jgi:hypothetical protein
MPIELLDNIQKQAAALPLGEKVQLATFLAEQIRKTQATQTVTQDASLVEKELIRQHRKEWMKENRPKYGGLYVALDGVQLLGTGRNFAEAAIIARDAGVKDAFIDYVMPLDGEGYMGGW